MWEICPFQCMQLFIFKLRAPLQVFLYPVILMVKRNAYKASKLRCLVISIRCEWFNLYDSFSIITCLI